MNSFLKSEYENVIFERSAAGIILLDQNGFIFQANKKAVEIFGKNIEGGKWVELLSSSLNTTKKNSVFISLNNGKMISIATESLYPYVGQMIVIWDETEFNIFYENKAKEQKLEGLSKLIASMAHQLRTPLTTALIYSDNLNKKLKQDDSDKVELTLNHKKLQDQLKHIQFLIDDMLIYAKGGEGVVSEIYIDEVIKESIETVSGMIDINTIALSNLSNNHEKNKYIITGNKESLVGAFANLIINAYQACSKTKKKTEVKITISNIKKNNKKYIQVNIIDNGSGIPEEIKNKIFDPFFTTKKTGTGVGLFVVQSVITAHKGDVSFCTSDLNGTTFSVNLPVLVERGI